MRSSHKLAKFVKFNLNFFKEFLIEKTLGVLTVLVTESLENLNPSLSRGTNCHIKMHERFYYV